MDWLLLLATYDGRIRLLLDVLIQDPADGVLDLFLHLQVEGFVIGLAVLPGGVRSVGEDVALQVECKKEWITRLFLLISKLFEIFATDPC